MSLAFTRFKLRCTTYTVNVLRRFCDNFNIAVASVADPLRRVGHRIGEESPWVVVLFASMGVSLLPLLLYPTLRPLLVADPRRDREEERVRLCLQKGIDPYPYMRHKDYVFGNTAPATQSEEEVPLSAAWEHQAMLEFQRAKEKLRQEVGGNVEDSVAKMLALREEMRKEFRRNQHAVSKEPKNLIFGKRDDVDKMQS
ncbi:hypothetical protein LSM04_002248 [Trypanosoma melophagium]|uniref:uncharacterized protein n=1 Tax=Trypanosoma melophagium TaxID=715481 RepID=UPI00351A6868|nr:hypothetical protein LSM04_002248 [Trypanosoma melophagium]